MQIFFYPKFNINLENIFKTGNYISLTENLPRASSIYFINDVIPTVQPTVNQLKIMENHMIRINENYLKLKSSYLFSEISRRVSTFQKDHPEMEIIRMGIGDVTLPLPSEIIKAFHAGVDEMASSKTFRGYGPEQGYDFLRETIAQNDFKSRGADITADEIFISDGAKCDTGNFQELFSIDTKIAIPDPVYPVYVDTNVMAGRTGITFVSTYTG